MSAMQSTMWTQTIACGPMASVPALPDLGGRASLENPSVSLNDEAAYDLLTGGGGVADSGVRVSRETALHLPAVWNALVLISGDVAKLPFDLYRKHPNGDREQMDSHSTHLLVNRKPNREMNAFKFWQRMMVYRLLWNNAFAFISRKGDGTPHELFPLLPDRTCAERLNGQLYYSTEVDGKLHTLFPEQVLHLEGISLDNLQGQDIIAAARDSWGLALAGMKLAAKFYRNGARTGGILELPASMPKTSKDKVEEGFRKSYENNDESFKTVILRDNAKFHEAQMTPAETQMTEGRREGVRDVARYFCLAPSKLGEENRNSYKSKSEDNRDYLDTTLSHHTASIKAEANDKLLTPEEKAGGYYLEHNFAALLQMDFKSVCEGLNTLRASEIISANEARQVLNYNRRTDPGGDEYRNPNTKSGKTQQPAGDKEGGDDEALARAHRQLLAGALGRLASSVARRARKPCASAKSFCEWLDSGLAGQRATVRSALEPILMAHAAATGADADELATELVATVMDSIGKMLNGVAESTAAKDLYAGVERALADFGQTRCLAIAEQFIK